MPTNLAQYRLSYGKDGKVNGINQFDTGKWSLMLPQSGEGHIIDTLNLAYEVVNSTYFYKPGSPAYEWAQRFFKVAWEFQANTRIELPSDPYYAGIGRYN